MDPLPDHPPANAEAQPPRGDPPANTGVSKDVKGELPAIFDSNGGIGAIIAPPPTAVVDSTISSLSLTAGINTAIGGVEVRKAAISGRFIKPFYWGTLHGRPACLMCAEFEFSSPRSDTLKEARVEVVLEAEGREPGAAAPRVRRRAPTELRSLKSTSNQITRGNSVNPKVDAGGFGGGEIGEIHREDVFSRAEGWSIVSNIGGIKGGGPDCRVWWDLSSNILQRQGVKRQLIVALIVEHGGDFEATFKLSGTLDSKTPRWMNKLFGREKEVISTKSFYVKAGDVRLDAVDLEELVGQNRKEVPGEHQKLITLIHNEASDEKPGFV